MREVTIDGSWYVRPPGVPDRTGAGGVVVRQGGGRLYVALAREPDFAPYVLPKGGVESGESLEAAARREIEEETGLSALTLLAYLGTRERLTIGKDQWQTMHFFLFLTEQVEGRPTDPEHSVGATWFALDALPDLLWPEQRELLETNRGRFVEAVEHFLARERAQ